MQIEPFNHIVEIRIAKIREVLCAKGKEYGSENDRLHNFKIAAKLDLRDISPEQALLGMWRKHLVSVLDLIDAASTGKIVGASAIDEKIGDSINYLILLEALMTERVESVAKDLAGRTFTFTPIKKREEVDLAENSLRKCHEESRERAKPTMRMEGYRYDDIPK